MPTITFQKKELKKYLKKEVADDKLRENMSMMGTDIDKWGEEISVEIFPDRPDLLSVPGLARGLNHFLGFEKKVEHYKVKKGSGVVKVLPSAKGVRPFTACAIIRNMKFDDDKIKQVIEVQEKLHITFGRNRKKMAMGVYPLEKIKLPITFGAEKPEDIVFQPLEMAYEMNSAEMLKSHPTGEKYSHLLEGYEKHPVFRDANKKVLSVPPILNSHDVGKITHDTKDVFIECSGHELKPQIEALNMIVCALADMGGEIESMTVDYGNKKLVTPDLAPKKMKVDLKYLSSRGAVPEKEVAGSLLKMGLELKGNEVTIPAYRVDFIHQVDVGEDMSIGYGYNNITPTIPNLSTIGKLDKEYLFYEKVREVLAGFGLIETMNYCISNKGVELANPLTVEYSALRPDIMHQLLDVLSNNLSYSYPQNIFDVGTVFASDSSESKVKESVDVACLLCSEEADYTQARQILEALGAALEWNLKFEEEEDERFIVGRCAKVSGSVKGVIGEIHPVELERRGIQMPAAGFEIKL